MITIISLFLISMTIYGIYLSFGPPSKKLDDIFDEHEH